MLTVSNFTSSVTGQKLGLTQQVILTRAQAKLQPVLLLRVKYVAVGLLLALLSAFLISSMRKASQGHHNSSDCYMDHTQGGRVICIPPCPKNHFILPGMMQCHKMLTCKDIKSNDLQPVYGIGTGAVKAVFLGSWNGYNVAINTLAQDRYREDFLHGLGMLHKSHQSRHVTKLLGYCQTVFVSEYHILGDASKLPALLTQPEFQHLDTLSVRLDLCIHYAEAIAYFHSHHTGTRVFCDSNTLNATLQQFLVTSSLHIIANDLDALPKVEPGKSIRCGHRPIYSEFAAPEQCWPYPHMQYNKDLLPGYDEKVDIWKIPDICEHFLGSQSEVFMFHVYKLHSLCKSEIPGMRPNASFVVSEYRRIQSELGWS